MISPDLSGAEFRKSTLSGGSSDNCVEVALDHNRSNELIFLK